jgi:hypothetical protein
MTIKCILCGNEIKNYHADLNSLEIDETRTVDICSECIRKFLTWQQEKYATLFPTKRAKKFGKKHGSE